MGRNEEEDTMMTDLTNGPTGPYDMTGNIIAYEQGDLDDDDTITLFQHLVDTGLAWQLQGSYGRAAMRLIKDGLISRP